MRTLGLAVLAVANGCRPSDILSVPAPAGVLPGGNLQSQTGAESVFNAAKGQLFYAADGDPGNGLLGWSGVLTDEFAFNLAGEPNAANVDARRTAGGGGFNETGDPPWGNLLTARASLVLAVQLLGKYEPASGRSKIGESYALMGYSELLIAEAYCAGTPLDEVVPGGGVRYGTPLTTDALTAVAQAHFDSGVVEAHGDPQVLGLASIGLGRALMDRNQYAAAATAVKNVPATFVYNVELLATEASPYTLSVYSSGFTNSFGRWFIVGDHEGGNGLNFVSAHDPRLLLDTTLLAADGTSRWYFPLKFEANLSYIPLATGLEGQLIQAEAALSLGQSGTWLNDLNTLRNSGCTVSGSDTTCSLGTGQVPSQFVGLPSLSDPGTDSGRVSLMFRERAFWLFGTGTRLGDLRRLIRQYGRDQSAVFPTGVYPNGENPSLPGPIPTYGTDVSLTLPTPSSFAGITNPSFRGCLSPTSTP